MALTLLKSTVNLPSGGTVTPNLLLSGLVEVNYGGPTTINAPGGALDGNLFAIKICPDILSPGYTITFAPTYRSALADIDGIYTIPSGAASFLIMGQPDLVSWTGFFMQDQGQSHLYAVSLLPK